MVMNRPPQRSNPLEVKLMAVGMTGNLMMLMAVTHSHSMVMVKAVGVMMKAVGMMAKAVAHYSLMWKAVVDSLLLMWKAVVDSWLMARGVMVMLVAVADAWLCWVLYPHYNRSGRLPYCEYLDLAGILLHS